MKSNNLKERNVGCTSWLRQAERLGKEREFEMAVRQWHGALRLWRGRTIISGGSALKDRPSVQLECFPATQLMRPSHSWCTPQLQSLSLSYELRSRPMSNVKKRGVKFKYRLVVRAYTGLIKLGKIWYGFRNEISRPIAITDAHAPWLQRRCKGNQLVNRQTECSIRVWSKRQKYYRRI